MIDFDGMAKDWDSDPTKIERALAVAEAIRKMIPLSPTMSSLEYGCGTGLLSFALQQFVGQITLVDTSRGMLSVLEKRSGPAH